MTADDLPFATSASAMRDDPKIIAREKLQWLEQVALGKLRGSAPDIAILFATKYSQFRTRDIFVSGKTLADDHGVCENTIWNGISTLTSNGHLLLKKRGGRAATNTYTRLVKPQAKPTAATEEAGDNVPNGMGIIEEDSPQFFGSKSPNSCVIVPNGLGANPYITRLSPIRARARAGESDEIESQCAAEFEALANTWPINDDLAKA